MQPATYSAMPCLVQWLRVREEFCDQQQRLHRRLPWFGVVFCLGQFRDEDRSVAQSRELFALW
jgi:hypothetical protein